MPVSPEDPVISAAAPDPATATQVQARLRQEFLQGAALHQQGKLADARKIYESLLERNPRHGDALHRLGVIEAQSGNSRQAADLIGQAIAIDPANPEFHCHYANALKELGQLDTALACYDEAIRLKPDYSVAYCNRGLALAKLTQPDAAVSSYDKAIQFSPEFAQAYNFRGLTLKELGQFEAAIASYDTAIKLKPDYSQAHINRGLALKELGQLEAAVASYDIALGLTPNQARGWYNRGVALDAQKQFEAAVASYDKAIALEPNLAQAYSNRGVALVELKQLDAAVASYEQVIRIDPDFALAHYNLGLALNALQQFDAAIACYDKAIGIEPQLAGAHNSRGHALKELGQLEAAVASFDQAIRIQPDHAMPYWHKGVTLLLDGDFQAGWELCEWRWKTDFFKSSGRGFPQPLWLGKESLNGKTILLRSEQGLGDTIQFIRYAALVAERGAKVIARVPQPLIELLRGVAGVNQWIAHPGRLPAFDFHCPLLSLPLCFNTSLTTIPSAGGYITSSSSKVAWWQSKLGSGTKKRVGLVWSGNADHKLDRFRSIRLSSLIPYLPDHLEYISLQKELREIDKPALEDSSIRHFGADLHDFTDTAALCELMDVVISVDTSVAHLAGALGKTTWVLLPYIPDWRWLLNRTDSPWYASAHLYRQEANRDWRPVLKAVMADLAQL